jgi:hypothetical protein
MKGLGRYAFYLRRLRRDLFSPLVYEVCNELDGPQLGPYYLMFSEEELLRGGSMDFHFDEQGIPMVSTYIDVEGSSPIYYPISIGQYGLAIFHTYLESQSEYDRQRFMRIVDWFYDNGELDSRLGCVWRSAVEVPFYRLQPGWVSSFAQSRAISILLRGWQLTGDDRYYELAVLAARPFSVEIRDGGVRSAFSNEVFYEEYPSSPPSHVLNGMMFSLFGLYDLVRVVGRDTEPDELFHTGIAGLKRNLSRYDLGYWSLYDAFRPKGRTARLNPATVHYHHIHIAQLDTLARITGDRELMLFKEKWQAYVSLSNKIRVYRLKYRVLRKHGRL